MVADTKYDLRKPAAPADLHPAAAAFQRHRSRARGWRSGGDRRQAARRSPRRQSVVSCDNRHVASHTRRSDAVRERLLAMLSGFFALVGLVLAAVGLYGVLSYSVVQRTREIGIRVALGARELRVVRMVLAEVGGAAVVGTICGLAGGLYLSRFVKALLFEVTPLDFWSLALPLGALLLAALLAATLPALRAARVDPVIALRYE